jgi:hypothetical protein
MDWVASTVAARADSNGKTDSEQISAPNNNFDFMKSPNPTRRCAMMRSHPWLSIVILQLSARSWGLSQQCCKDAFTVEVGPYVLQLPPDAKTRFQTNTQHANSCPHATKAAPKPPPSSGIFLTTLILLCRRGASGVGFVCRRICALVSCIPMSALPPRADMCSATRHVCFGPKADMAARKQKDGLAGGPSEIRLFVLIKQRQLALSSSCASRADPTHRDRRRRVEVQQEGVLPPARRY